MSLTHTNNVRRLAPTLLLICSALATAGGKSIAPRIHGTTLPASFEFTRSTNQTATTTADKALAEANRLTDERSYERALGKYQEALRLYRSRGNRHGEAVTLEALGSLYEMQNRRSEALDSYMQALAAFRETKDRNVEAVTLNSIGRVYDSTGDSAKALEYYEAAQNVFQEIGARAEQANVLSNIGIIYLDLGEGRKALEFYNQSLSIFQTLKDREGEARTLNNIGRAYTFAGEFDKAQTSFSAALQLWRTLGDKQSEAITLNNVAAAFEANGDLTRAFENYTRALQILRQIAERVGEATILNNIGFLMNKQGKNHEALDYYHQALVLSREIGDRETESATLDNIGAVYESLGEKEKASEFRAQSRAVQNQTAVSEKPNLHIFAIGIGRYPQGPRRVNPSSKFPLWNLQNAVNDARDLSATFETSSKGVFGQIKTHLLLNSGKTEILNAFDKIIQEIRPEDTLVFSYSGQGFARDPSRSSGKREFYLMPSDFSVRIGLAGAISATLLRTLFTKIQAHRQLIILDARESSEGFEALASSIVQENQSFSGLLQRDVGVVALSEGARIDLVAGEGKGHGLLTYALLNGMKGNADQDGDGVSVKELIKYAQSYVSKTLQTMPNLVPYQRSVEVKSYFSGEDFPLTYNHSSQVKQAHVHVPNVGVVVETFSQQGQPTIPQTRSEIVGRTDTALSRAPRKRTGKDYALLIATNTYEQWSPLPNPVVDAKAIEDELKNYYGFETQLVENPTKAEIVAALKKYKNDIKYAEDDQLFIFLAGHGTFIDDFREGYIVARNSLREDPDASSYLSHSQLRNIIDQIPCRHIFLVIDACFGGTFDEKIARRGGPEDPDYADATNLEFIDRKMRFETRQFLTSGGKEYVPDGRPGQHSPFARKFLEALRSYGGRDGILTITRILSYVERVTPEPRRGEWGGNEPGSDFIFIVKRK